MGCGAKKVSHPDEVPPGHIWMPYFEGIHLSIDYERINECWHPRLIVQGVYEEGRPVLWRRLTEVDVPTLPTVFDSIDTNDLNVEYVGGNVIEAHLRRNPDFENTNAEIAIPIWGDMIHRESENGDGWLPYDRLGFVYLSPSIARMLRQWDYSSAPQ